MNEQNGYEGGDMQPMSMAQISAAAFEAKMGGLKKKDEGGGAANRSVAEEI
jgi:hypothetical protein